MSAEENIRQIENYVECWKQFNQFLQLAGSEKITSEDEAQFLELKSVLVQELELVLSQPEATALNRLEIHDLINGVSSLRFLAEAKDDSLRQAENQWHKIYIQWQSVLGQLKVKYRAEGGEKSGRGGWFR